MTKKKYKQVLIKQIYPEQSHDAIELRRNRCLLGEEKNIYIVLIEIETNYNN